MAMEIVKAPTDPEKNRPYFYIIKDKEIFTQSDDEGKGVSFLYQSDGRLISSATFTGNVTDEQILKLMETVDGFKKLVLFNSHGGNTDMANLISRDLRIDFGLQVFVFDWWFTDFWADGLKGLKESGMYGVFHACELETSLMLAARPDLVYMDKAVDEDPADCFKGDKYVTVFGPVNAGWKTNDVTKSGVIGAPTFATAEKGKKLFDYACKKLINIFSEIADINY